jgi:hypothetical protein
MQKRILVAFALLSIILLCAYVAPKFPARIIFLWILTLSFIALIFLARYQKLGYGYIFLTLFLFLGFWVKPVIHLIYPFPYSEPVGGFTDLPTEWNEIIKVLISGIWGVIFAGLVMRKLAPGYFLENKIKSFIAPVWYLAIRKYIWLGFVVSLIFIAVFNIYFGIHQIGLHSQNYFVWPTNALISLMLVSGFSIILATLLWWDISLRISISKSSYFIVLESSIASISLLSRGVILFHSLPLLLPLWNFRGLIKGMNNRQILFLFIAIFLSLPLCYLSVNYLREFRYFGINSGFQVDLIHSDFIVKFLKFSIDRWVGMEGLMAVVSYPDKNYDLLVKGLLETGSNPMGGIYQWISWAHYRFMDMNKFIFASVPGPIGFFYYSGSLLMVFMGMFVLTLSLVSCEILAYRLTANPILCSFYGFSLANVVFQFGIYPRNNIPFLLFLLGLLLFISLLQSKRICAKLSLKKKSDA